MLNINNNQSSLTFSNPRPGPCPQGPEGNEPQLQGRRRRIVIRARGSLGRRWRLARHSLLPLLRGDLPTKVGFLPRIPGREAWRPLALATFRRALPPSPTLSEAGMAPRAASSLG